MPLKQGLALGAPAFLPLPPVASLFSPLIAYSKQVHKAYKAVISVAQS